MNTGNLANLAKAFETSGRYYFRTVTKHSDLIIKPKVGIKQTARTCTFFASCRTLSEQNKLYNFRQNRFCNDAKYLYLQTDPETFGDRRKSRTGDDEFEDEGDRQEKEYIENPPSRSQKLPLQGYARLIKAELEKGKIKEALDILEVRMLKTDRVKPDTYIYNLLISACGKVGYTQKAFQLYNRMKQRDLKVTGGTVTSLFNACANCPYPNEGIEKANHLRELLLEKRYEPNEKNYNSMIKAYGRCGDIKSAFSIVDEMIEKGLGVKVETYNFILQACTYDKDLGFRHALLVWHKLYQQKLAPDIYSFGIMLQCVRDCGLGDIQTLEETILEIFQISGMRNENHLQLSAPEDDTTDSTMSEEKHLVQSNATVDQTPNLLSPTPRLGSLVSISEVQTPEDRLLLLGGFSGFLEELKRSKITPGIEMFTALLEVIPSTVAAEKLLITAIRKIGLKADIDFFNTLIKKRSLRFDYDGARSVIPMIRTAKLQPDIITFGVLALGCQTQEDARNLLQHMREKGIRMNVQILGAMLRQGCANRNFAYVYEIMQIAFEENIKPNEYFLRHLHSLEVTCSNFIKEKHPIAKSRTFKHNYENFVKKLREWREKYEIENLTLQDAIKKFKGNPYKQFKENQESGFEEPKNDQLRKKQKLRKYIKKIKVNELDSVSNSNDNVVINHAV